MPSGIARYLLLALVLVLASCASDPDLSASSGDVTTTDAMMMEGNEDGHGDDHGDGHHDDAEPIEVSAADAPVLSDLVVSYDEAAKAWVLNLNVENFKFAPEDAGTDHVMGEGHLHIYVDGVKVGRVYDTTYEIGELPAGEVKVRLEANAKNHSPYTVDGEVVHAMTTVTVAEEQASQALADVVLNINYADGEVSGVDNRIQVAKGKLVELNVTTDVAEEVHVHGLDAWLRFDAPGTDTLRFTADIPGVIEIEFEQSGLLITELEIS